MKGSWGVRVCGVVVSMAVAVAGFAAGDVLQQLRVSPAEASEDLIRGISSGSVNFFRVREVFKPASPAVRAALVEQTLNWAKAYVSSAQFAKNYAQMRADAKPSGSEGKTVESELARRKKERQDELARAKKDIEALPKEIRKEAEEGLKAAAEAMKQYESAEMVAIEREEIESELQQESEASAEDLARWNREWPADPKPLVKLRLQELLRETADVDYAAKLNGRKFANPAYEAKSWAWKLAYRAGKAPTDKARAFAQAWLAELK